MVKYLIIIMYKYEIEIEKNEYYLSFELININNDDFKLIKDIDNDQNKIDILKYYDSKYNLLIYLFYFDHYQYL